MLAQIDGKSQWRIQPDDPMRDIGAIDALRTQLEAAGVPVPPMRGPQTDPLGCMIDWRDFLATIVTVH
jgi:hypothetical protein